MELLKELELIAGKCEAFMKKPPEPFTANKNFELYKLIKTELQNIAVSYKNVNDAKELLSTVFNGITEAETNYGLIYGRILTGYDEYYGIFRTIYNMKRNEMNYSYLVKTVFSFDIIRFICHAEHSEQSITPDYQKELAEISGSDNKFLKGLPMDQVVKHFEKMTVEKSKNGKVFLTPEQLVSFLKKGFLNDTTQLKQKINCSRGEKGLVILRFYELYDLACSEYDYPARKEKFIKLFVDCFDNWNEKSVIPFFRSDKTKTNW